jgi:HD-like signal output (HDOD) protein
MIRVLFVDDDPRVLAGLSNAFRRLRGEMRCQVAHGGGEALQLMAEHPADIIISDARMPEIEGPELLRRVQLEYPATVRIVLSGQTDIAGTRELVNVAHMFLNKPCDVDTTASVIRHVAAIRRMMPSPELQALVGSVGQLPFPRRTHEELLALLGDSKLSLPRLTQAVEESTALTAKVLQMVNSSFFGPAAACTTVEHAVKILGPEVLRNIATWLEPFDDLLDRSASSGVPLERGRMRSLLASRLARRIVSEPSAANAASLVALLHDVGLIVLSTLLPERLAEAIESARARALPAHVVEAEVFGASHAVVGAYLLGLWGFPLTTVEAVAHHHDPMDGGVDPSTLSPTQALRVTAAVTDAAYPASDLGPLPVPLTQWWPDAAANAPRIAALEGWQHHASRILAELQESFHAAAR